MTSQQTSQQTKGKNMRVRAILAAVGIGAVITTAAPATASVAMTGSARPDTSTTASCSAGFLCGYNSKGTNVFKQEYNWGPGKAPHVKSYKNSGYGDGSVALLEWEGDHGGVCVSAGQSGTFNVEHTITRLTWWDQGNCPR